MLFVVVLIIFWEVILKILFAETLNLANILVDDSGDHLTSDLFEPLEDVRVKLLRLDGNYAAFPRGLHNGFFRHLSHLQVRVKSKTELKQIFPGTSALFFNTVLFAVLQMASLNC